MVPFNVKVEAQKKIILYSEAVIRIHIPPSTNACLILTFFSCSLGGLSFSRWYVINANCKYDSGTREDARKRESERKKKSVKRKYFMFAMDHKFHNDFTSIRFQFVEFFSSHHRASARFAFFFSLAHSYFPFSSLIFNYAFSTIQCTLEFYTFHFKILLWFFSLSFVLSLCSCSSSLFQTFRYYGSKPTFTERMKT